MCIRDSSKGRPDPPESGPGRTGPAHSPTHQVPSDCETIFVSRRQAVSAVFKLSSFCMMLGCNGQSARLVPHLAESFQGPQRSRSCAICANTLSQADPSMLACTLLFFALRLYSCFSHSGRSLNWARRSLFSPQGFPFVNWCHAHVCICLLYTSPSPRD